MISILLLLSAVALLLIQRRLVYRRIVSIALLLTGNKRAGLWIYSLIFFPGVLLHEMSHFLVATFLGVRTGDISLFPTEKEDGGSIALGSVKIAKTDFFRESLIGAAPFIFGSLAVYWLTSFLIHQLPVLTDLRAEEITRLLLVFINWKNVAVLYLIYAIGNTMFVSSEDTRAWPLVAILVVTLIFLSYFSGHLEKVSEGVYQLLLTISLWLGSGLLGAALLNTISSVSLGLTQKLLEKILHKRVVFH